MSWLRRIQQLGIVEVARASGAHTTRVTAFMRGEPKVVEQKAIMKAVLHLENPPASGMSRRWSDAFDSVDDFLEAAGSREVHSEFGVPAYFDEPTEYKPPRLPPWRSKPFSRST